MPYVPSPRHGGIGILGSVSVIIPCSDPGVSEARGCLSFLGNVCGDALLSAKLSAFPAAIQSLSAILDDMDDMAAAHSEFLPTITVAGKEIPTAAPPQGFVLREELGILAHESTDGTLAYRAEGSLFECKSHQDAGGRVPPDVPHGTLGEGPRLGPERPLRE